MRYSKAKFIYHLRRALPLYADDNSRIYSAYSAHILKEFSSPDLSVQNRYTLFLHFAEHFIDDISGERMAHALSTLNEPQKILDSFQNNLPNLNNPRVAILFRKTKRVLNTKYKIDSGLTPAPDFTWSAALEKKFDEEQVQQRSAPLSIFNIVYWPYLAWRFIFRFKNRSAFARIFRQHLLKSLSSPDTEQRSWLKNFEKYTSLFKSQRDMEILAEVLKVRSPGRDLALLEFTYRVHRSKPKTLLYYRRLKIVLANSIATRLPEYVGSELTAIFFNPLENKRQRERERLDKKRAKKIKKARIKRENRQAKLKARAEKRREKTLKSRQRKLEANKARAEKIQADRVKAKNLNTLRGKKRREKIIKSRQRKIDSNKARAEKIKASRVKARNLNTLRGEKRREKVIQSRQRRIEANKALAEKTKAGRVKARRLNTLKNERRAARNTYWQGLTPPLKSAQLKLYSFMGIYREKPVQLIMRNDESGEIDLRYIPANKRIIKSDLDLAIFYVTGRFDPYLDISMLGDYSKVVILNGTGLSNDNLEEQVRDYLGSYIDIECFSPSRLLIKPYTTDHQNISDLSDSLAKRLIETALKNPALKTLLDTQLSSEYEVALSDKMLRAIERFYAAQLFFETIAPDTPIFFNSLNDSLKLSLAKQGFTKIIILNGETLLGEHPKATPSYDRVNTSRWLKELRLSYNQVQKSIRQIVSADETKNPSKILLATHSRSSIHKISSQRIEEALSQHHSIDTFDIAPQSGTEQTLHSTAHNIDRKLRADIRLALLPNIQTILTDFPLNTFDSRDLTEELSTIISRNIGLMLSQTALFHALRDKYSKIKSSVAVLVPGRYAEIRTIARAFQSLGLQTLDIQLLFLSTMARYKAPITSHQAVIDEAAKNFYIENFKLPPNQIKVIGSITRDEDVKLARSFGRAASLEHFELNNTHSIITLACQPGFEAVTQSACEDLADYLLSRDDVTICIKLHPAQSPAHLENLTVTFQNKIPADMANRYQILQEDPFWKLMPVTDILISYFSNVCLQACAFNIPVLSLPGGGPRPKPDFEDLGLARNVNSIESLSAQIDALLQMPKAIRAQQPPYKYLQDNPHMADDASLQRLTQYIDTLLKAESS